MSELNKIKEILFLTGADIKKVFKKAFEKIINFNLSNILIIMLDEYLVKENKITICKEIKNSPFYKEKEKFEEFLKIVKQNIYFFVTYYQLDIEEEESIYYIINFLKIKIILLTKKKVKKLMKIVMK